MNRLETKSQNLTEEYIKLLEEKKDFYDAVIEKMSKPDPKL